jgi:cobalamin biosynthesis Mg chelatase CobN
VVYSDAVAATEKSHLAGLDELDAGWEENKPTEDGARDTTVDALDAGWDDDEDAEDPPDEPEEALPPEPPGLTPEQRRARKEELAARALARKERARAEAVAKKERRRARAEAAGASKKRKQKRKSPARERASLPSTLRTERRDESSAPAERAIRPPRRDRSMAILGILVVVLVAVAAAAFFLKR